MPLVTIIYGLLLVLLGVGGYFGSGQASFTALIPAIFGLVAMIAGLVARKEHLLKHAMHGAAMVGLLGFLIPGLRLLKASSLLSDGTLTWSPAITAQAVMSVLSAIFVALCVRSFIQVRKARQAAGG